MLTDLVQIRRMGERKRPENERFRQHLKRHGYVERRFRKIAAEIEEDIDCRSCAQCCKQATVRLLDRDVERLAKHFRLSVTKFVAEYCEPSTDEGIILRREAQGCVFLSGNDCTVYDVRPSNCLQFPHTVRGDGNPHTRMWDFIDRATYCPIVYNTIEAWKEETKFPVAEAARNSR